MSNLVFLPFLLPFLTAIICLIFWRSPTTQRILSLLGSTILLGVAILLLFSVRENGILVAQAGNWAAPFGITIVVDLLSAIMVLLANRIALSDGG